MFLLLVFGRSRLKTRSNLWRDAQNRFVPDSHHITLGRIKANSCRESTGLKNQMKDTTWTDTCGSPNHHIHGTKTDLILVENHLILTKWSCANETRLSQVEIKVSPLKCYPSNDVLIFVQKLLILYKCPRCSKNVYFWKQIYPYIYSCVISCTKQSEYFWISRMSIYVTSLNSGWHHRKKKRKLW